MNSDGIFIGVHVMAAAIKQGCEYTMTSLFILIIVDFPKLYILY